MTHPIELIYSLTHDLPVQGKNAEAFKENPGICCVTGKTETLTAPANRVLGTNYGDRKLFNRPDSDLVGWPAAAVLSGGGVTTFRMWTIIATPGRALPASQEKAAAWLGETPGLCLTSKKDTTPVIDTLWDPPAGEWLIAVAESAQKHVLPYTQVNTGTTGTVRFETLDVPYTQTNWRHVFTHALALRRLGIPAADVLKGTPRYLKTSSQLTQWREHDTALTGWHNSPLLRLALWVITKGIIENDNYPKQ